MLNCYTRKDKPNPPTLWRYMNLPKFLSFLQTGELHFSSLSKMNDVLEGANFSDSVKIHQDFKFSRNEFVEKIKKLREIQNNFYACCFNDHKSESKVMFDLYSTEYGVAICFDSIRLFEQINIFYENNLREICSFEYGYIDYPFKEPLGLIGLLSTNVRNPIEFNPFSKQNIHAYEKEYRFVFHKKNSDEQEKLKIKIDISLVVKKIVAHPNFYDWEIDVIKDVIKKYDHKFYFKKSSLITNEILKRFQEEK